MKEECNSTSEELVRGEETQIYIRVNIEKEVKPWSNGLASSRKLKTWVYFRHRLARPCVHLR